MRVSIQILWPHLDLLWCLQHKALTHRIPTLEETVKLLQEDLPIIQVLSTYYLQTVYKTSFEYEYTIFQMWMDMVVMNNWKQFISFYIFSMILNIQLDHVAVREISDAKNKTF